MDYLISNKAIFVEGYKNAAIYDLKNNKVYKINQIGRDIINRVILHGELPQSTIEREYLESLINNNLYDRKFRIKEYKTNTKCSIKLSFAWLEITQACNLKCLHCYIGETHKQSCNFLSVDKWIDIINQLFDVGCRSIQFIGGEPCVYPYLISLIDYAGAKGFESITVFTNASIITDELISCFLKNNVNIRFSLYGHTEYIHDAITQICGSFGKTIAGVKRLLEQGINVSPAVIIMYENQSYTEEIKVFIKSLGLKYKGYDVIRNVFGGQQTNHMPTDENIINNSKRNKPDFYINEKMFTNAYQTNTCWYGKFAITEIGTVLPCIFERNIIFGDLKKQTIQEILESEILKKCWLLTLKQVKTCMGCEFKYSCVDCRPLGKGSSGDILGKNPRCTYDPKIGEWNNGMNNNKNLSVNCDFYS